jgi:long-chain acyl-CoA synthetase
VFREYLNLPDETREVITSDGWFKTGDVGEFSRDGFLRITDRKKDFIITAGGENIAPQMIETSVMESKFINYCMVYGDRKKYLSALLTLNTDAIKEYASQSGINGDLKNLATHPKVNELINSVIKEKNTKFARYETIKKFIILDHDFSQETGELTPTLKIRRRFTIEKYREVLEGLYRE